MRISNGIYMLELAVPVMGKTDIIHPTLLHDETGAILLDTGYPGIFPLFRQAFEEHQLALHELHSLIITHQDIDHIGSLPAFISEFQDRLHVLSGEIEKPYIEGERMLIKVTPEAIEQAVASMPANVTPEWKAAFRKALENPPKGQVNGLVRDGELLPYGGGLRAIETPGHTPGHFSFYHIPSKTLIAADALVVSDGQLMGPVPAYCVDYSLAIASISKLTHYDIENVICYHGGLFTGNANARIAELAVTG